jgi:hypothetical protein
MNLGDWLMIPANFVGVVQRSLSYFGITWDKVSKSFVVTTFFTIWVCTTTVFEGMISAFNSVTQDLPEAIQAVNDTVNSESPDTSILAQVNYILPIDFLFSCLSAKHRSASKKPRPRRWALPMATLICWLVRARWPT